MSDEPPPRRLMRIDEAPYRLRREHYRRERRNSAIAVLVLVSAGGLLGWAIYRLFIA